MNKKLFLIATLVVLLIGITSCERQGPAEQTGVKIEEVLEKAQDKLETDPQEPNKQTEQKIDESIDQIGKRLEKLGDTIQEGKKE